MAFDSTERGKDWRCVNASSSRRGRMPGTSINCVRNLGSCSQSLSPARTDRLHVQPDQYRDSFITESPMTWDSHAKATPSTRSLNRRVALDSAKQTCRVWKPARLHLNMPGQSKMSPGPEGSGLDQGRSETEEKRQHKVWRHGEEEYERMRQGHATCQVLRLRPRGREVCFVAMVDVWTKNIEAVGNEGLQGREGVVDPLGLISAAHSSRLRFRVPWLQAMPQWAWSCVFNCRIWVARMMRIGCCTSLPRETLDRVLWSESGKRRRGQTLVRTALGH